MRMIVLAALAACTRAPPQPQPLPAPTAPVELATALLRFELERQCTDYTNLWVTSARSCLAHATRYTEIAACLRSLQWGERVPDPIDRVTARLPYLPDTLRETTRRRMLLAARTAFHAACVAEKWSVRTARGAV